MDNMEYIKNIKNITIDLLYQKLLIRELVKGNENYGKLTFTQTLCSKG